MKIDIHFEKLKPVSEMCGESDDETIELNSYLTNATEYLSSFSWHKGIKNSYFGMGVGGIFSIFLFEIIPKTSNVDNFVWVVVGDIPPAYITCEEAPNPACALDGYIGAMLEWVDAVEVGGSIEGLIPVNAPPSKEYAKMLKSRLAFLDERILSNYKEDLKS
ncbi:MAG: hypothetical protein OEZ47_13535 [Gammaproteobacteria bacterium]|nr:hypothetical protein [Gammaproteobacteria bacterium]